MAVKGPYNTSTLQAGMGASPSYYAASGVAVWEAVVDHSLAANQMLVADTMPLFKIPAGIHLIGASVETIIAEGAASTVDMGITGGDVDGYIDGATTNSVGVVVSGDAGTAEPVSMETSGRRTVAEELVSILVAGATMDNAKVRYQVMGIDARPRVNATSTL